MTQATEMRKILESVSLNEMAYGPIETLHYVKTYLEQHGNDLHPGDVEELLNRINYALKLAGTIAEDNTT